MTYRLKNNLDRARRRKTIKKMAKKNVKKHMRDAYIIGDEIRAAKEHFAKDTK